jgi:hypothetical protein
MSARDDERPKRVLAAWGYESDSTGDRVEVDVWTVNEPDDRDGEPEAIRRAREAFGGNVERVIAAYGNVARVEYAGIGTEGYRYIREDEAITENGQNAFAGAKRSAGGSRSGRGTFGDGYSAPPGEPEIEEAINEGTENVIPVIKRDARGPLAEGIGRQPSRDEEGEAVETRPLDGFTNIVRYYTRGGVERYHVRNGRLREGEPPEGRPT